MTCHQRNSENRERGGWKNGRKKERIEQGTKRERKSESEGERKVRNKEGMSKEKER